MKTLCRILPLVGMALLLLVLHAACSGPQSSRACHGVALASRE